MAMLMVGQNLGSLSGTMTTAAVLSAGKLGYSAGVVGVPAAGGVVTATVFANGMSMVGLWDDTGINKFQIAVADPTNQLVQGSFLQIVMNSITFTSATATFFASAGTCAIWQWTNGGTQVTGNGRTYALT